MNQLSLEQQKLLFTDARSHHAWLPEPVSEAQLKALYDLGKWGPTSANSSPGRLVFLRTASARERLVPALMGSNVEQVRTSAVTVIVAQDLEFYEKLPQLMPAIPDARSWFAGNDAAIQSTAFRNSSLQGAYFMLAARSLGLDVCPMSGFDNAKVDAEFFKGKQAKWRSNFIFALGRGDASKLYPRSPRLTFDEACQVL
jgi:3-hydroxypropanoate dehydrogenase